MLVIVAGGAWGEAGGAWGVVVSLGSGGEQGEPGVWWWPGVRQGEPGVRQRNLG